MATGIKVSATKGGKSMDFRNAWRVGTPEHGLLVLVLLEMVALGWLRVYFKSAHGG